MWVWIIVSLATAWAGGVAGGVQRGLEGPKNVNVSTCQYDQVGDQCLYFANTFRKTREEGRLYCQSLGGDLVAIKTATQMQNIMNHIPENGGQQPPPPLVSDKGYDGYWINGQQDCYTGEYVFPSGEPVPMGTPFWAATMSIHQPDGNGPCFQLYKGHHFYGDDVQCDHQYFSICEFTFADTDEEDEEEEEEEDDLDPECAPPFQLVGGLCLTFLPNEDMTWEEAEIPCMFLGGHLAKVDDIETLRAIYLHVHSQGMDDKSFWLGGTDMVVEGSWHWTDGRPVPMGAPFWGLEYRDILEPVMDKEKNCLGLQAPGMHYFRAVDCQTLQYPLCMATNMG